MDLDPATEVAEHALEDHNEQMDEMALFGHNVDAVVDFDAVEPTPTIAALVSLVLTWMLDGTLLI
jgi:hypothetical protein